MEKTNNYIKLNQAPFSMTRKYTILVEQDEDGWLFSEVIGLPGCRTQAKTMDELLSRAKEAIQAYLADNTALPKCNFVGLQQIEV